MTKVSGKILRIYYLPDQENGISEFVHQSCFRLDFHADDNHGFCPGFVRRILPGNSVMGFWRIILQMPFLPKTTDIIGSYNPLSENGDLEGMTVEESSGWVIKIQ